MQYVRTYFNRITLAVFFILPTLILGQDLKESLFNEVIASFKETKKMNADILAPKSYGEAMKLLKEAESDFKKGGELEGIQKKLKASSAYLLKAKEATKLANVTLSSSFKARNDALKAGAETHSSKSWEEAEDKFREAGVKLEEGDVKNAQKKSKEAEDLFRKAELQAIKTNYFNETWVLLDQANEKDVKKYAPATLARSKELIKQAEKELNENRYDTDVARDLAKQAKYEARHALFLAKTVKHLRNNDEKIEAFLLSTEKPLEQIASKFDFVGLFDSGYDETTARVIENITTYQDSLLALTQALSEKGQQLNLTQARVSELENKLGGVESEKSALAERMQAQAKIREQFASVGKLFEREEAQVLREGNSVIIRLVGLNFSVGKSTIEPQYFSLLTKVQKAINTFPNCGLVVEGHTDSHGGDKANFKLSEVRAEAVKEYLLANMGLEESRISSVGYGESNPIANNETVAGRTKNRRIDVVIQPQIPGTY